MPTFLRETGTLLLLAMKCAEAIPWSRESEKVILEKNPTTVQSANLFSIARGCHVEAPQSPTMRSNCLGQYSLAWAFLQFLATMPFFGFSQAEEIALPQGSLSPGTYADVSRAVGRRCAGLHRSRPRSSAPSRERSTRTVANLGAHVSVTW